MRNLLALVGAAVVTFVGVGWYLGWFSVQKTSTEAGKTSYNVEINKAKIESDLHRGEEKLHGMLEKKEADSPPVPPPPPPLDTTTAGTTSGKMIDPPSPFDLPSPPNTKIEPLPSYVDLPRPPQP